MYLTSVVSKLGISCILHYPAPPFPATCLCQELLASRVSSANWELAIRGWKKKNQKTGLNCREH